MATRAVPTTVKTAPVKHPTGLPAADVGLKAVFIKPASEYVPARLPAGKILFIKGQAIVRHENGELRELHAGDVLAKGDMVLTSQNGYIQIESPGSLAARQPDLGPDLARAELNLLDVAPAAGLDGDGNLTPAIQVERISEVVSPSEFVFDPVTSAGGYGLPTLNSAAPPVEVSVGVVLPTVGVGPGNSYTEVSGAQPQFSVSLSGTSPQDTTVQLTLSPGPGTPATLTAPGDFAQDTAAGMQVSLDGGQTWTPVSNGTITIPAGQTGALVRLPAILDDSVYEGPEQLTLTASADNAGTTSTSSATATITDEEDRPKVNPIDDTDGKPDGIERVVPTDPTNPDSNNPGSANWTVAADAKTETDTSNQPGDIAYFRISLSGTAVVATTLHVQASDGLAKIGTDYSNLEYWNGTAWTAFSNGAADISVPANTSSLLLRTTVLGDNVAEPSEAFRITAYTDAQTASPVTRDIAILDDDAAPVATADTGWGVKGAAINGNVIQGDALGGKADTDADDGTAGLHLVSFSATVGGATQTATLDASGSATLTLTGVGSLLMRADGSYTFTPLAGYTGQVPQIGYTVADSSNVNTAQGTLDLSVLGFSVVSSATGGTYAEASEPRVQYTVTFDSAAPAATTVTLAVQGGTGLNLGGSGTATNPADFKADVASNLEYSADGGTTWSPLVNGQAILPAGKTELLVRTPQVNNDALYEGPEQLTLTASVTAPGGTTVSASGVSTITDEEDKPKVNPQDPTDTKPDGIERVIPTDPNNPDSNNPGSANWTVAAGAKVETDTSNLPGDIAYFRINLSGTAVVATTLHVQASDGLAKIGTDYSNLEYWNGSAWTAFTNGAADISVPANTSSLLLRSTILGDNVVESAEAFKITAYTDAQTASPSSQDITIADDDAAPVATADTGWGVKGAAINGNVIQGDALGGKADTDADDGTAGLHLVSFSATVGGATQTATLDASGSATLTLTGVGSLLMRADGSYTFTPLAGYTGQVPQIGYTVADSSNVNTAQGTLDLSVLGFSVVSSATGGTYAEASEPRVQYTVTFDSAAPAATTVTLAVQGGTGLNLGGSGTATNPADFKADVASNLEYSADGGATWSPLVNGQAILPAGKTELLVRTPQVNNDALYEGPEQLTLTASVTAPGGTTVSASGVSTITDEEDKPKVNPQDPNDTKPDGIERVIPTDPNNPDSNNPGSANWTVAAGAKVETDTSNQPGDIAYFRINLSGTASITTVLHVQAADGTAKIGTDYSNLEYWNGTAWTAFTNGAADISVPANTSSLLLRSTILGDNVVEPAEAFKITAYTDAQTASPISRDIAIADDDAMPVATAATPTVAEDSGTIVDPALLNTRVTGTLSFSDADDPTTVAITTFTIAGSGTVHTASSLTQATPTLIQLTDTSGNTISGAFFYLKSNGEYGYILPANYNSQQSVALPTVTYTVSDGTNSTTSTLALTVTPVNDAPIARDDQSQTLIEASTGGSAGTSTTTGNVISGLNDLRGGTTGQDTDVDSTTLTVIGAGGQTVASGTPLTLNGTYGTLQINSDGSYTYTLDNSRTVTDALKSTDKVQDVFSYTVSDSNGGSATASLAVNIQGANDAPKITTDPTTYTPITVSENALSSGTGTSANASAVASSTRTITITDNDSDLTTLTYRFDLASLGYIYGTGTGASTQTKLVHFDSASRKYYDVSIDTALYNSSNGKQLVWYADLNGNGTNDGGSENVLRLTLTSQSSTTTSATLLYKVELLGSLYHNTDFDLTYNATDEWSMDPHNGVDLVALKDLQIAVSDGTGTAVTPVTVNVVDDSPAIISSTVNTGADQAYVYQWNVLQKINGVPVHLTYWMDYDTVNKQYHAGYMTYLDDPMASSAGHQITGLGQAASATSLSEATPYYIDATNNKLYIYSSLGLIHEIDLVNGTSTVQNQPSTGYVNEMIEFVMLDYDGDFFTKPVAGVGANPFVSLDTAGNNTAELVNGTALGDTLRGAGGNDTIYGDGMDAFGYQDRGADLIIGGLGNDVLYGGSYGTKARGTAFPDNPVDDQLASSYNSNYVAPHTKDVFAWQLGDGGSAGSAATDTIKDFDPTVAVNATGSANSGDVLDLSDLLSNEHDGTNPLNPYNLDQYLQVTVSNGTTTINVNTQGQLAANGADQVIELNNVDLSALLPTGTTNTSDNIIKALIDQKRLVVDT